MSRRSEATLEEVLQYEPQDSRIAGSVDLTKGVAAKASDSSSRAITNQGVVTIHVVNGL